MWPILIKADDLFLDANLGKWGRFIKTVDKNKSFVDIGFISKPPEYQGRHHEFSGWLNSINLNIVDFFDHGIMHHKDEYTQSSNDYYIEHFRLSNIFQRNVFSKDLQGFGAPYNSMSINFLEFFKERYKEKYIYYPDIVNGSDPSGMKYVSFKYHTSFELPKLKYDPSFAYFRATYSKAIGEHRPLVLQVHPNRWSDEGFVQFSEILTYIRRLGGCFLNARDFIHYTLPDLNAIVEISRVSKVGKWFEDRYSQDSLAVTRKLTAKILSCAGVDFRNLQNIADFGSGVGDWLYLLSSMNADANFFAIEPNKDLAEFAAKKLSKSGRTNIKVINCSYDKASLSDINLTLCNRALNYFNHVAYVKYLRDISAEGSRHYIGYQNIAFYLMGLLSALKSKNYDLASRRVNVLISSLEFFAGMLDRKTNETCVPVHELIELFRFFGFEFVGESHQEGIFSDRLGTVTGLVFNRVERRQEFKECSFEHIGLVDDINKTGRQNLKHNANKQNINYISQQLVLLKRGLLVSAENVIDHFKNSDNDRLEHILSIIVSFKLGLYNQCENLLLNCDYNDF